jgi:PAS domain S-box-containing protein
MSTLGVDRLGEVVEQSASEIYVFAADDFRFILVNRGARENLGYSLAELSEMHPWDLKPEFSEEEFKAFVGPLLSAEVPRLSFETVHGRKDGSTYEVSVSLQLIQSQGEFVFFAAIRDISEFNSIRDRLERTSSRLDAILNNTRMAIFMMDEQQNCSFMNRAAEELTGYSFEEAVGRCLHGLIHHQYPRRVALPDRRMPHRPGVSRTPPD